jgi:hypothetical protein
MARARFCAFGPDFYEQEYMCHFLTPLDAIFEESTVPPSRHRRPRPIFTGNYDLALEDTHHMLKREFLIAWISANAPTTAELSS